MKNFPRSKTNGNQSCIILSLSIVVTCSFFFNLHVENSRSRSKIFSEFSPPYFSYLLTRIFSYKSLRFIFMKNQFGTNHLLSILSTPFSRNLEVLTNKNIPVKYRWSNSFSYERNHFLFVLSQLIFIRKPWLVCLSVCMSDIHE